MHDLTMYAVQQSATDVKMHVMYVVFLVCILYFIVVGFKEVGQTIVTPINTCCCVMEALLQKELASSRVVSLGRGGGGCISDGRSYETDSGRVFVKRNSDQKAITDCIYSAVNCFSLI